MIAILPILEIEVAANEQMQLSPKFTWHYAINKYAHNAICVHQNNAYDLDETEYSFSIGTYGLVGEIRLHYQKYNNRQCECYENEIVCSQHERHVACFRIRRYLIGFFSDWLFVCRRCRQSSLVFHHVLRWLLYAQNYNDTACNHDGEWHEHVCTQVNVNPYMVVVRLKTGYVFGRTFDYVYIVDNLIGRVFVFIWIEKELNI